MKNVKSLLDLQGKYCHSIESVNCSSCHFFSHSHITWKFIRKTMFSLFWSACYLPIKSGNTRFELGQWFQEGTTYLCSGGKAAISKFMLLPGSGGGFHLPPGSTGPGRCKGSGDPSAAKTEILVFLIMSLCYISLDAVWHCIKNAMKQSILTNV